MKKKKKTEIGKFTRHQIDRHRALLASAPESIEKAPKQHFQQKHNVSFNAGVQPWPREDQDAVAPDQSPKCLAKGCNRRVYGNSHKEN